MDIPIVPILTNCIAPPMPRPKRYFEVGKAIRAAIDSLPTNKRIGVLVSGHLSLEVGGPKQFERHLTDPNFDAAAVGWIVNGDIDGAAASLHARKNDPIGQHDQRLFEFSHDDGRGQCGQAILRRRLGRRISGDPVF